MKAYKVVRELSSGVYASAIVQDCPFVLSYAIGKRTSKFKGTQGVYCFTTLSYALDFISSHGYQAPMRVLEVETDKRRFLLNPLAVWCKKWKLFSDFKRVVNELIMPAPVGSIGCVSVVPIKVVL